MNKLNFDEFIEKYDLYSFDGLLSVTLIDGSKHQAVWIQGIPELGKSVDGKFEGLPDDHQLFYVFDVKMFAVWKYEQIEDISCMQQKYLI